MPDSDQRTSRAQPQVFPHTRWSVVLAATQRPSPEADAALETICRAYWYPLYAFVRRSGQSPPDAQDLTQEFFRRLLEKRWLAAADREKGRLRTFLVTALKHFMAKEWRRASAQKRGGSHSHVPMDTAFAESRYAAEGTTQLPAEAVFDQQWALTLLDLSEGAARVAVHRMRKRFRELYREEIAQTLPNSAELDAELRYLAGILAHS